MRMDARTWEHARRYRWWGPRSSAFFAANAFIEYESDENRARSQHTEGGCSVPRKRISMCFGASCASCPRRRPSDAAQKRKFAQLAILEIAMDAVRFRRKLLETRTLDEPEVWLLQLAVTEQKTQKII